MAADRRRRPAARASVLASALAAVALTTGLATGCDPADKSLGDCLQQADVIADSLKGRHLDEIDITTDDDKVGPAVDDLNQAIEDYNEAVLNGDTDPDSSRIDDAAEELRDVCAS
ncbi:MULTISPECIES: hypothetical protein [unclassified Streptomyces]|uniref:hypothetical protein n=1 Tax=unclassified Streptomyces TaxID=2593676 RepID=UPI002366E7B5|nr:MULTISPECIES: hypothetical protein [unclassified Streptomyces]MDF3144756.1 hypothetical protein [Streptomyces sp. T21Q-yed]WDF41599.1 hypothetical protein PBV52_34810 [Streptomyces sp. T12]